MFDCVYRSLFSSRRLSADDDDDDGSSKVSQLISRSHCKKKCTKAYVPYRLITSM